MASNAASMLGEEVRRENSRTVRASLAQVVEVSLARWARVVMCLAMLLLAGLLVVLTWAELVYSGHEDDQCDQPLAAMLRLIFIIVMVQAMQKTIVRHCLCYDMAEDGPMEPLRVRLFRALALLAAMLWPVVAGWMLLRSHSCSADLKAAVAVILGYYAALVILVLLLPAFVLSVMLCLIRRGLVALPRMPGAAPEGTLEQLPVIDFDEARFNDAPSGLPSSCAVCLDAFNAQKVIVQTSCGHVFHRSCLGGWLQVARSCPLCRSEMAGPELADLEKLPDSEATWGSQFCGRPVFQGRSSRGAASRVGALLSGSAASRFVGQIRREVHRLARFGVGVEETLQVMFGDQGVMPRNALPSSMASVSISGEPEETKEPGRTWKRPEAMCH
ncbi:unnamed protein product [Effrenium voratum]|uniref:RING-type domain-containing protein n=1 Tax=Effrenium voratum TaxID=2562239 RepID=A0AA36JHI3_9DINO|nr:unnamed protein product [Effrenium voratum]